MPLKIADKVIYDWNEYFQLCDNIVSQLENETITDIIGISRGGLIPAQYIAYKLNIPRVHNFGIISYSPDNKKLSDHLVHVYQQATMHFDENNHILLVDDIADTGKTFEKCLSTHWRFYDASSVKIAALHYKIQKSNVKPDFFAEVVNETDWIVYPYDG